MIQTIESSSAAKLLLARLLAVGKSSPGPKKVRVELGALGASLAADDQWEALLAEVRKPAS